jgi:hypothetical protein
MRWGVLLLYHTIKMPLVTGTLRFNRRILPQARDVCQLEA